MNKLVVSTLYGGLCGGLYGFGAGTLLESATYCAGTTFADTQRYNTIFPLCMGSGGFMIGSHIGIFCFNPYIGIGVSSYSLIGASIYTTIKLKNLKEDLKLLRRN